MTGALRLLAGRSLAVPGSFLNQGLLQLAGGTVTTSSTLTVAGTLSGFGTIVGGLSDGGLVEATGGALTIVNITSGAGRLQIDSDGTLELTTTSALSSSCQRRRRHAAARQAVDLHRSDQRFRGGGFNRPGRGHGQ